MIFLNHFVLLSGVLFCLGAFGVITRRDSLISVLVSIELMLLAANINFVVFSVFYHSLVGQIFALFVLCVAAAEIAIGLAILITFFKNRGHIDITRATIIKDN